jgi:Protein of unknown function (DUF1761)
VKPSLRVSKEAMDEMSFDVLDDLNWLAVVVATAIYYGLAAPWFADPLFGRAWRQSIGWKKEAGERLGPRYYLGPVLTCLVAVIAVAMLSEATGSNSLGEGLVLGLVVAVGIVCTVLFVTGALDPQRPSPAVWFAITGGYHVIGLVTASLLIAVW